MPRRIISLLIILLPVGEHYLSHEVRELRSSASLDTNNNLRLAKTTSFSLLAYQGRAEST